MLSINKVALALFAASLVSAAPLPAADNETNALRFARGLPPKAPSKTEHSLRARQSPSPPTEGDDNDNGPFPPSLVFTSTYDIAAVPGQVVDGMNNPTGGLAGASGRFQYGINSVDNFICYDIELFNFPPPGELTYQSAAATATHIHESAAGRSGPPRIAFPNPQYQADGSLVSRGCLFGPFRTGLPVDGSAPDTGAGFTVAMIESNPSAFNTDTHTSGAVPGAVRGQFPAL